jgi:hypothetical protein
MGTKCVEQQLALHNTNTITPAIAAQVMYTLCRAEVC